MNTLNKLLDDARKMCSRDSDAAIAERVKVSRNTLMQWRRGTVRITDQHLAALIELAKANPAVAVQIHLEMASTPAEKRLWGPLWDKLSAAAAVVALVILPSMSGHAKVMENQGVAHLDFAYHVYYVILGWLRTVTAARAWPCPSTQRCPLIQGAT